MGLLDLVLDALMVWTVSRRGARLHELEARADRHRDRLINLDRRLCDLETAADLHGVEMEKDANGVTLAPALMASLNGRCQP